MLNFHVINHVAPNWKYFLTNWTQMTVLASINLMLFFEMCSGCCGTTEFLVTLQTHCGTIFKITQSKLFWFFIHEIWWRKLGVNKLSIFLLYQVVHCLKTFWDILWTLFMWLNMYLWTANDLLQMGQSIFLWSRSVWCISLKWVLAVVLFWKVFLHCKHIVVPSSSSNSSMSFGSSFDESIGKNFSWNLIQFNFRQNPTNFIF